MFSQNDPRWKDVLVGTGPKSIGEVGCLLTCFAQVLTNYERPYTPAELNQELIKRGVFINGNELPDDALESWPDVAWLPSKYYPKLADFNLEPGEEIIIRLYNKKHFVLFKRLEGGKVIVADPLHGDVIDFAKRYGDPLKNIYRMVRYRFDAELVGAMRTLQSAGIVSSPGYWLDNARAGKTVSGENARALIIKAAAKLGGGSQ